MNPLKVEYLLTIYIGQLLLIDIKNGYEGYLDKDSRETLDAIWEKYCSYSAFELVELTHKQEPWRNAYPGRATIKNSDIKFYFQSTY